MLSDFVIYCGIFLFLTMCDRVCIPSPSPQWDCPITDVIETKILENVFVIDCINVEKSLCIVLGEEFLQNSSGSICYKDIVSKFLTNCMDLLENVEIVKQMANTYLKHHFKPPEDYDPYIVAYVIEMSSALIGGLFSLESLSSSNVTRCVYYSLKFAISSKYKSIVHHAVHVHRSHFSDQDASRILDVCGVMIFLQIHMSPLPVLPYVHTNCSMITSSSREVL